MQDVLKEFEAICKIPRPSFHEERIRDYLYDWAKQRNIYVEKDNFKNVFMKKPATKGYENCKPIALQAHTDMVCEKAEGINHDFFKDPIKYYIDGDIVSTRETTTLGADDGLGVSIILSVLADNTISHPEIEAVFTSAEEEDFSGVGNFDMSKLKSRFLINLDHCCDNEIVISAAGGITFTANKKIEKIKVDENYKCCDIKLSGLEGGHSGEDIHRGKGNSNILLFRFLDELENIDFYLQDIKGGNFRLAIPRTSNVSLMVAKKDLKNLEDEVCKFNSILQKEFPAIKDSIKITMVENSNKDSSCIKREIFSDLKDYILTSPSEIQIMSNGFENFVDCSCNLGEIYIKDSQITVITDVRAGYESQKQYIIKKLKKIANSYNMPYTVWGSYPGWEYKSNSKLGQLIKEVYEERGGKNVHFLAIHAGLECSFFDSKIDNMDIVSIGSNAWHYHSPKECFSLSSLEYFYKCFIEILKKAKF